MPDDTPPTPPPSAPATIEEFEASVLRFLAMLSHELRNPLAAINNALRLIERRLGAGGEEVLGSLDMIGRQSKHMQRLLDDLLDVARVTQGKIHLRKAIVELRRLVGDVVAQHREALDQRRLTLATKVGERPLWVHGDAARIVQILDNLLTNAIKYTPEGGHVEIEAGDANGQVIIRVRDDGAGIDDQTRARIFELFVQADTTLDRSQGGLGVGLTLVHQLVELHGGAIEVHSEGLGQGSEFVVRFPQVEGPQEEASDGEATQPAAKAAGPGRVVVVEDHREIRDTLVALLFDDGFAVDAAPDGLRGLELITELRPDAALLDIGLPGIDGYELARRLRADPRTTRTVLIAMTGYGRQDDRVAVDAAGFDAHLIKPVDIDEVVATLIRFGVQPLPSHT